MQDFEKLGVFYLGKEYDLENKQLEEKPVLYKSKDLTTHAVIIGMTGSGKTGLGVGIIEEAAIDSIPVIVIDPKGDLGNLALTFPQLRGEDFLPWVNLHEAANRGLSTEQYAQSQAELWRQGLADWGQDGKRIERLRNTVDITVYTPGSSAGPGVSVLRSFDPPPPKVQADKDAYRDRIKNTTTGLMSLIGIGGDPFTNRKHILVSNILEYAWNSGQSLSLPELISAIQEPPVNQVGVMDMESFYPAKDRFLLASMFNNLLASPSFNAWLEGDPLDVSRFLYDEKGKPRVSVFSISHLSDSERMFFVTMLLNEILSWMRSQPGTGSLRALLYMDELFGYLPPIANPPSKVLLLTLLKQARAYGLGLVLSTQNPVDLDYKALSNTGTWFIGRLQTEKDKERVLAGLEGSVAGSKLERQRTRQILAGLGKRIFYLHNIHEDEPVIFHTRWTLSYLAGPLTREQISALQSKSVMNKTIADSDACSIEKPVVQDIEQADVLNMAPPILDPKIPQVYLPVDYGVTGNLTYVPSVIGAADVLYSSAKYGLTTTKSYVLIAPLREGPVPLDWREAKSIELDLHDLDQEPVKGASFANYPSAAANPRSYDSWKKLFTQFIRTELKLKLFFSPTLKVLSEVDEDKRDFRIRLQHLAHEKRDEALDALRKKYASRINTLENRHRQARQVLEKQSTRAAQQKMDAAVSAGTAILGALFGRKSISTTSISRVGTAVKSTSRALKSGEGIAQARETLRSVEAQLEQLELELEQQVEKITQSYNLLEEKLEEIEIRATGGNIAVHLVGLAWCPSIKGQ
jgi:prefoldin subunit 5